MSDLGILEQAFLESFWLPGLHIRGSGNLNKNFKILETFSKSGSIQADCLRIAFIVNEQGNRPFGPACHADQNSPSTIVPPTLLWPISLQTLPVHEFAQMYFTCCYCTCLKYFLWQIIPYYYHPELPLGFLLSLSPLAINLCPLVLVSSNLVKVLYASSLSNLFLSIHLSYLFTLLCHLRLILSKIGTFPKL